jgi:hypothetical protein
MTRHIENAPEMGAFSFVKYANPLDESAVL